MFPQDFCSCGKISTSQKQVDAIRNTINPRLLAKKPQILPYCHPRDETCTQTETCTFFETETQTIDPAALGGETETNLGSASP